MWQSVYVEGYTQILSFVCVLWLCNVQFSAKIVQILRNMKKNKTIFLEKIQKAPPPSPPPQGGELYDLNADMVGDGITVGGRVKSQSSTPRSGRSTQEGVKSQLYGLNVTNVGGQGIPALPTQPSFTVGWVLTLPPLSLHLQLIEWVQQGCYTLLQLAYSPSHNPSNHTTPLPAGEGLGVGLCGFLYGAFFVLFPKRLLLPSKTTPFIFQKDSFCNPKRTLLQPKRTPFFLVFNF